MIDTWTAPAYQVSVSPGPPADLLGTSSRLASLVARTSRGDQGALAALYDETSAGVHGLALRILRDRSAAEEVTLEVYLQVFQQAERFDPDRGTPMAWLLMMARSRALSRLRAEVRRRGREEPLEAEASLPGREDVEAASIGRETRDTITRALAALTPDQREVIELAYYLGLSHSEISARLGRPLGTVKTAIRRGMMTLRACLGGPPAPEDQS